MIHTEAGPREQVLGLKPEQIAESVMMRQALGLPARIRHVVNEFAREGLVREIAFEDPVPADDGPTIWMSKRRLLVGFGGVHRSGKTVDRRVEEVEHQLAVRLKVVTDGAKAGELLLQRQEILERTERHRD